MIAQLNVFAFVIAFAVGMLFIYMFSAPPVVVVKFPSPWNSGNIVYKSENDKSCFVYKAKKTECPIDEDMIRPQPF